jgi:FkbH-like protein
VQQQYNDENEFLQSLNMRCSVSLSDEFNIPRIAQLTQRTNQFNLRTIRYTDEDIARIFEDPSFFTLSFNLADKYGDYGLVSLMILQKIDEKSLFIDTWVMSCRVFNRYLEEFTMNYLTDFAFQNGFSIIFGEYLPTSKNAIVKDVYPRLGFIQNLESWMLKVADYKKQKTFVKLNQ